MATRGDRVVNDAVRRTTEVLATGDPESLTLTGSLERIANRQTRRGIYLTSIIAIVPTSTSLLVHLVMGAEPRATVLTAILATIFVGVHLASRRVADAWLTPLAGGFGLIGIIGLLAGMVVDAPELTGYLGGLVGPIPIAMALFVPWGLRAHLIWLAAGAAVIGLASVAAAPGSLLEIHRSEVLAGFGLGAAFSIAGQRSVARIRRRIYDQVRDAHRQRAELMRARRRLVDTINRLQAIEAIDRRLADEGPTPEALDAVMGLLVDGFGYWYPSIYVGDARGVRLGAQRGYDFTIDEFDTTKGVTGRVLRTRHAQLVPDVTADPDYVAARPDVVSEIQVPLMAEGRLLGVLNVESRFRLDEGDLASVQVVADRVAASMALAAHRRELLEAQRMESIGRLAGGVAHDFNNLLTVINGYASLLADSLPAGADVARSGVEEVRRAADRAAELTRQLLGFARRSVLEPTDVELNAIVQGVEPMLSRLIGERITLVTRLADGADEAGWVRVDPALIGQVVVNLVVNARDAMPSGGTITIATGSVAGRDLDPGHPFAGHGRVAMLSVADTGVGIDPEVREHIFEPFVTTKPVGEGTGLGLATTYGIVAQSGGTIRFDTEVGRGTTFEILLSRVAQVPVGITRDEPVQAVTRGRGTIMFVEDEPALQRLGARVLESAGYIVRAYPDGETALAAAHEDPAGIDLLVSDVVMPGRSGPELYRELLALRPGLPALFMSGYPGVDGIDPLERDRIASFIAKPFTPDALTTAVRGLLGEEA